MTLCKNCGHSISLINEEPYTFWAHDVKGVLDFCKYYNRKCDCGCESPEPKIKKEVEKVGIHERI